MLEYKDKFILLFAPQPTYQGRRVAPISLLAISCYLDLEGYDIKIFHSYDKEDYLEALNHLDKAICIGITSMTGYQITDGLEFAKLVRQKNKKVPIVWGGIHPTILPEQTAKHPLVDIVVKGQGEITFTELVHRLDKKQPYNDILGITYKKNGKIINNPDQPIKRLEEFPPMPYHLLWNMESYLKKTDYGDKHALAYISSQGCPHNCRFCYVSHSAFARRWDGYSAKRVVNEIEDLVKKYNVDAIDLRDSNFFVDEQRVIEICQRLLDKNLNIGIVTANGRVEQLSKYSQEIWALIKRAGFKEIVTGMESGDQDMLNLINKCSMIEDSIQFEKFARKHQIQSLNSFMTGFPPTTNNPNDYDKAWRKELNASINVINNIFEINPLSRIYLFFYTPYFGTDMYQQSVEQGFKSPQNLEAWGRIDLSERVTPWVTDEHCRKIILLRILFMLKRITSKEFLAIREYRLKNKILKYLGIYYLINHWVSFRLKHKFFALPFEILFFKHKKA
ncbi:MAG: radical SAM protein [Patescibacteria group bacterium]